MAYGAVSVSSSCEGGTGVLDYIALKSVVLAGAYGVQNPTNHWGIIFGSKMMILQGVGR